MSRGAKLSSACRLKACLHRGERLAPFLELPLGVQGQHVGELLRNRFLRPVAVPRTLAGVAHRLQEPDLVLNAHNFWSFRVVLDELADEDVLTWMRSPPCPIAGDVRLEGLKYIGVRHDDGVLPPVPQQVAHVPYAQQHDDAVPATARTVFEVTLVAVTVTVGPLEVLDDDPRAIVSEHDVRDVLAEAFLTGGINLLGYLVAVERKPVRGRKVAVDPLDEQSLEGVTQFVCPVSVQQPREHVGQLLLVGAVVHHLKDVELLGQTVGERGHQHGDQVVE